MPDELLQMRRDIEDARKRFRGQVRMILRQAYADADSISTAIGEISVDEAYDGWVRSLILLIREDHEAEAGDANDQRPT